MKIFIELEQNFGHPNNSRPTKESMIEEVIKELPKKIALCKGNHLQALEDWQITSVRAEGR